MITQQQPGDACAAPGMIFDLLAGPVRMAVLDAALEMELADILAENETPEAIARTLGVKGDSSNLVYFLDAMTALGLADKKNGCFANTAFAEAYLRKSSPSYVGGLVKHISRMQHRNLGRIPELVRQGPPEVADRDKLDKETLWKQSVGHLANYQKGGMADRVADLLSSLPEFPGMNRMMDIGCGPGIMCMTTVARHPSMRGVLYDLPPVLEVAREEIAAAGMEDRITTVARDYNEVDFGTGFDLAWASQTLYYVKDFDAVFTRIHEALNPGGVFVSLHEGLTEERTRPANLVLSRLSLALEGQDVSFEKGQLAAHLPGAGFAAVETRIIDLPVGSMELVIARKGE